DLGSAAPGGDRALPPIPGGVEDRQSRERAERSAEEGRESRRGRRGGRGRGESAAGPPAEGALSLAEGFDLLKRVLTDLGAVNGKQEGEDKVRELMTELYGKQDEILTHRPRFGRFLRQAQDAKLIDVTKTPAGYEVSLKPEALTAEPVAAEPTEEVEAPKRGRGRGRSRARAADDAPAPAEDRPAPAPAHEPAA